MLHQNFIAKAVNTFKDFKEREQYFVLREEPDYYDVYLEDYLYKTRVRIYKTKIGFSKEKAIELTEEDVKNHLAGKKYNRILSNVGTLGPVKIPRVSITVDDFKNFLEQYKYESIFTVHKRILEYRSLFYLCVKNARFLEDSFYEGRDLDYAQDIDLIASYLSGLTTNSMKSVFGEKYGGFAEILEVLEQSIKNRSLPLEERIYSEFELFSFRVLIENYAVVLKLNEHNKEIMLHLIQRDEILNDKFTKFQIAKLYFCGCNWLEKNIKIAKKLFSETLNEGIIDSYLYLGLIDELELELSPEKKKDAIKKFMIGAYSGIDMCKIKLAEKIDTANDKEVLNSMDIIFEIINDLAKEVEKSKFSNAFPEAVMTLANIAKKSRLFNQYEDLIKIYLFQARFCLEKREYFKHNTEHKINIMEKLDKLFDEYGLKNKNKKIVEICNDFDIKYMINILGKSSKLLGINVTKIEKENFEFQLFNIDGEDKLLTNYSNGYTFVNSFISLSAILDTKLTKRRQLENLKRSELCEYLKFNDSQTPEKDIKELCFVKEGKNIGSIYVKKLIVRLA